MAHVINTEQPAYINKNIEIFNQNKLGQYSKYLDKNPLFWSLYAINVTRSTADPGTENINLSIGKSSPLRFNKITEFPLYNIPEFKPNITYDETGYDAEMEISDAVCPPGIMKPHPGSYLKYQIPGTNIAMLFEITEVQYNTIQSNDYYLISMRLKRSGEADSNYILEIEDQVVETYKCIFENIGTEDKCLIRAEDEVKIQILGSFINTLLEQYRKLFFFEETEDFLLTILSGSDIHYLYDIFLTRFINESEIYYDPYSRSTTILPYNEVTPFNFDILFRNSLYYAVLKRDITYLKPHNCYYGRPLQMLFSPYRQGDIMCYSTVLSLFDAPFTEKEKTYCCDNSPKEYFSEKLLKSIKSNELDEELSHFDKLIYQYLYKIKPEIDYTQLLELTYDASIRNFIYLPVIIFILSKYYGEFFKSDI